MRRVPSSLRGAALFLCPLAVLAVLTGCGTPAEPSAATPTPSGAASTALLRELTGPATFQAGSAVRAARQGDRFSAADALVLPAGSGALVLLPDGASTVRLDPGARHDQAGRSIDTTFRILGARSPGTGIVVSGSAAVTVAPGTELTALCGAADVRVTGPAAFTVDVAAGNYADASLRVTAGQVVATSSDGGTPLTLAAGQQGTIRLPRGH